MNETQAGDQTWIDEVATRFDRAFQGGHRPRIEDYLAGATDAMRAPLLSELLRVELEVRRNAGESPAPEEYRRRFPEYGRLIDEILGAAGSPVPRDTLLLTGPHRPARPSDSPEGSPEPPGERPRRAGWPEIAGYDIQAELGHGAMGVVYQARQRQLNRPVALKMIRAGIQARPEDLDRFRIEAEAVARLRHPNIVQIYEIGESDGLPFVVLELLEGGSLADRLRGTTQPGRAAAELVAALALAMHAAHRAGIVHRDLKPSNVLFDRDGVPKVADFGLAKRLEVEEGHTRTGEVLGTPSYMAPEQAQGLVRQIGPPADVYALGAILYEMLAGRPPFKGPNVIETLRQVVSDEVVPPSRLQARISRDLETVCLKCLAKEPARRYPTAEALADDLNRFLAGESIRARRTPAWVRTAKWARRRPAAAALAALGLSLTIGLGVAAERYAAYVRRRDEQVAKLRLKAVDEFDRGLRQRSGDALDEARVTFTSLLTKLGDEPRLADLRRRAAAALDDVNRRRSEAASRAAVQDRYARFGRLRDRALLLDGYAAIYPETLDYAGDEVTATAAAGHASRRGEPVDRIRVATRAALDVFPLGEGDTPAPLPEALAPSQRAEVEADRYLLLIVLSEAVAQPATGEDPKGQAGEALRLLDRAATVHRPTPALHLRRAACLQRLGDAAAARLEAERAERVAPADAFDHLLLGREAYRRRAWDTAPRHLEAALRLRPDAFWAHSLLAVAALERRPPRAAEAKSELTACLLQQPSYAWLYLLRGTAYGQMGAALAAAARSPKSPLAAEAEARFEDAEADFHKAQELGLEEGLDYVLLMNRGAMRFQRGRWEAAAADFAQATARDPGRFNAYASMAHVLRKLGRHDQAIARLGEAIAREPKLAALYRARGRARFECRDTPPAEAEAALRDLEESARLEPPGSLAAADDHARRGQALLRLGRAGDAMTAADAALAIAQDLAPAHRVRVAALLALKRYGDVVDSCEAALAHGPASAELYRIRGLARAGRDDFAGAIEDYTLALALHPDAPADVYRDRGWAHLLANAPEMALKDFDAVLRINPADPDGPAGRATARVRLNRIREALADAEESLRRAEPSPRLLYIAAQTYTQASIRALATLARRGRAATRDSIAYEARAADLLQLSLERTPTDRRTDFWRTVVARDVWLRPLLANPRVLRRLQAVDGCGPPARRVGQQAQEKSE
jgi:tetratricopeptide (TPR) repeat protein